MQGVGCGSDGDSDSVRMSSPPFYPTPSLLPSLPLPLLSLLPSASLRRCSICLPTSSSSSYCLSSWPISRWINWASRNLCCCLRRSWMAMSLVSDVPIRGRATPFWPCLIFGDRFNLADPVREQKRQEFTEYTQTEYCY